MGKYLGALISVLVIAGLVLGVAEAVGAASRDLPRLTAKDAGTQNNIHHVALTLQTFPSNPYQDAAWVAAHISGGQTDNGFAYPAPGDNQAWVTYWPTTNLQVPVNTMVTITIQNYDSATPLLNPYYGVPRGTIGNTITVDGKPTSSVDPNNVSHTFTIHSVVGDNQPWLFVSVPVTGADPKAPPDSGGFPLKPLETSFSFMTPAKPGHYLWQCFDPCGSGFNGFGGPMSTKGYMSGTINVVA
jgi:hypothetical protein